MGERIRVPARRMPEGALLAGEVGIELKTIAAVCQDDEVMSGERITCRDRLRPLTPS